MYPTKELQSYVHYITNSTKSRNRDNISRTTAYFNYYLQFPEIKWSYLASLVSRNAGYNMTDLLLPPYRFILGDKERERLFMTYERANWLIFSDAYPQLLIYQLSKQLREPVFQLLKVFHVSDFMIKEWHYFWKFSDEDRLLRALIINEQNVIHGPVIEQSFFKKRVFHKLPYVLQNLLLMNAVLLPTKSTNLYGAYVQNFTSLTNRINLGKKLASILFTPSVYNETLAFAIDCEHTGSRYDYERYLDLSFQASPFLRMVYPIISHQDKIRTDWYKSGGVKKKWTKNVATPTKSDIGLTFYKKRQLLYAYYFIRSVFSRQEL
ncbi:MAG: DUF2515 family protein [Bacillota bacterium]|uniref:DUF2515 family protein n=1 Tax=Virgibacillus salarius TaxID=447199 RepID=A0A941I9I9_9BACI|nr:MULTISPECIES: DUF2515 family protein [Bacillaceae]NAZ08301.1 DUF2515 domain-containing protein [Agaribacter marinus]MBR7795588.1 DUF2515 family protein [Virgibacillus salarius]MCC2251262.1 DUF2515 domain-containing protein [Virgibacillus sp. AGTR]MDY7045942.1 DUF2515 family protein [Virgibacillus sp. M23]QRZ17049.1 DUF2515 family protein [Virgibacillus sp. AGTR]